MIPGVHTSPWQLPKYLATPPTSTVSEDGPGLYVNPINSSSPVYYSGMEQTSRINTAAPSPPREWGPGAADPAISKSSANYASDGYRDH